MTTPQTTLVGDLRCHTDARGQTQCVVDGNGLLSAPCVDGRSQRWVSPGDEVHGQSARVAEVFTDGAQAWARLTNGNVAPICPKSAPPNATRIQGAHQGVNVGQVRMAQDTQPSPPDALGVSPEQVCPPGWTLAADGTCVPPEAIATPDPASTGCPAGHYLREDGTCAVIDFDPKPPAPPAEGAIPEMMPDMAPAATPGAGATYDAKAKTLHAPGTMFDGMEVQPYGQGMCPEAYNGGKRAVFFTLGQAKMFATIGDNHGSCCGSCAVGSSCSGCDTPGGPQCSCAAKDPGAFAPRGCVRVRMGTTMPPYTAVAVRDRSTKVLVANDGYMMSLQPLKKPAATFEDAYGRTVYLGKRMWSSPSMQVVSVGGAAPMWPPQAVSVGGVAPVIRASNPAGQAAAPPTPPGIGRVVHRQGAAPVIGSSMMAKMPGLPPQNPDWQYRGPQVKL